MAIPIVSKSYTCEITEEAYHKLNQLYRQSVVNAQRLKERDLDPTIDELHAERFFLLAPYAEHLLNSIKVK